MRIVICCLLFLSIANCSVRAPLQPLYQDTSVTVVGVGFDLPSAKIDALRTAMQQLIQQQVMSDLVIVNEEIVNDILVTTMNGQLTEFTILDQSIDQNGFIRVKAQISIGSKELSNFRSQYFSRKSAGISEIPTSIKTALLEAKSLKNAKLLKDTEQLNSAKILSTRLFASYPKQSTEARLESINFNQDSPEFVELLISYNLKKSWLQEFHMQMILISQLFESARGNPDVDTGKNFVNVCPRGYLFKMAFSKGSNHSGCKFSLPAKAFPTNCGYTRCPYFLSVEGLKSTDIYFLIPVFSSDSKYMTCIIIDQNSQELISSSPHWYNRKLTNERMRLSNEFFLTVHGYDPSRKIKKESEADRLTFKAMVPSNLLYSHALEAKYFYPFLVSGKAPKAKGPFDNLEACESEGRLRHEATSRLHAVASGA
jgi:hypothetical protein